MVSTRYPLRQTSNRVVSFGLTVWHILIGLVELLIPVSLLPKKDVTNKQILITGSGSGLGQLLAVRFSKLGAKLILWDVNEAGLKKTVEMIKAAGGDVNKVKTYGINLCDRDAIYALAARVKAECGVVDILFNNAGVVSGKYLLDTPDEKIQFTFDVNVLAHFYTIKCFLPDMIKQRYGHIVSTASIAGHLVAPKLVDYCASKYANVGADLALRLELAQAGVDDCIRTTIIKPAFISTGMFAGAQSYLFPILKPDWVVDRIVQGVLTNQHEVILPGYLILLVTILSIIPARSFKWAMDFGGGYDAMSNFHGRQVEAPTSKEINNNNNNNQVNGKKQA